MSGVLVIPQLARVVIISVSVVVSEPVLFTHVPLTEPTFRGFVIIVQRFVRALGLGVPIVILVGYCLGCYVVLSVPIVFLYGFNFIGLKASGVTGENEGGMTYRLEGGVLQLFL